MNLDKKFTAKQHSFLMIGTSLPSNNPSGFRRKWFRRNIKTNNDNREYE